MFFIMVALYHHQHNCYHEGIVIHFYMTGVPLIGEGCEILSKQS